MGMLRFFIGLLLISGCVSVPERDLEVAFRNQRAKENKTIATAPIDSDYLVKAKKSINAAKKGNSAEYVTILELGDDALLARVHLIRAARRSIDLQTFIWRDDPTTRFLYDELLKAAQRGVDVRILIDGCSKPASSLQLARMAKAHRNLEICLFKPLKKDLDYGTIGILENLMLRTRHLNRRMHNKLLIIDEQVGIAGGRNYEGKYFDRDNDFLFRDRDLLVAGPAALEMARSFELFWQNKRAIFALQLRDVHAIFERLSPQDLPPLSHPEDAWLFQEIDQQANHPRLCELRETLKCYKVHEVMFTADTPRKFNRLRQPMDLEDLFEVLLRESNERFTYQTPYLIYNRNLKHALTKLRKRKPNFRVIASSNSLAAADHKHVYALSFKHRKELYKETGIDIYEAKPYPADQALYVHNLSDLVAQSISDRGIIDPTSIKDQHRAGPRLSIHAKSFVFDGKISLIGSHNFDPRSSNLNTECGVFVFDEAFAAELERRILNACQPRNAWTVSKAPTTPVISNFSGVIGAISTALPILDIWPYRYTSNYELKEGKTTLSPRDPNFQDHYTDVGYFPEVDDSSIVIKTRLIKTFFGWARSFM